MEKEKHDKEKIETSDKRALHPQEYRFAVMTCEVVHVHEEHVADEHGKHERTGNPL